MDKKEYNKLVNTLFEDNREEAEKIWFDEIFYGCSMSKVVDGKIVRIDPSEVGIKDEAIELIAIPVDALIRG